MLEGIKCRNYHLVAEQLVENIVEEVHAGVHVEAAMLV